MIFELEFGLAKSSRSQQRREHLCELISLAQVLPFGPVEAKAAARIRSELEQAGIPIGPYDLLIAATALSHGATLVTHNTREFSRVHGLMLEDWY